MHFCLLIPSQCLLSCHQWDFNFHPLLTGCLWLLLGLQFGRGPRGPVGQSDRETGGPQSPEPGGLRHRERRLRRRIYDQRLPLRAGKRRHRLWGGLPVHRRGKRASMPHIWNYPRNMLTSIFHFMWSKLPKQTSSHLNKSITCPETEVKRAQELRSTTFLNVSFLFPVTC